MRKCSQCGAPDHEVPVAGIVDRDDPSSVEHFVRPEIRYLGPRVAFSEKHKRQGWTQRSFQGRPALIRFMCVDCLNANDVRDRVWGQLRSDARKLEKPQNADAEFYELLCR